MRNFEYLKVGDEVTRMLAGRFPVKLKVLAIRADRIICGNDIINGTEPDDENEGWSFDLATGAEIDEFLNWGPPPKMTGSYLVHKDQQVN